MRICVGSDKSGGLDRGRKNGGDVPLKDVVSNKFFIRLGKVLFG